MSRYYDALIAAGAYKIRRLKNAHWVGEVPCATCGKIHPLWGASLLRSKGRIPLCRACTDVSAPGRRMGEKHHWFKRGQFLAGGYWQVTLPKRHPLRCMGHGESGTVGVHRIVMAEHLKRPLLGWEHVHHKNGNRKDNRVENLELLSAGVHAVVTQMQTKINDLQAENARLTALLKAV